MQLYLVVNRSMSARVVKSRPYLNNDEIAILLDINIPKVFFDRLIPTVKIDVPEESMLKPDIETAIQLTTPEISDKLKLDTNIVEDGLKDMFRKQEEKNNG